MKLLHAPGQVRMYPDMHCMRADNIEIMSSALRARSRHEGQYVMRVLQRPTRLHSN